MCSIVIIDLHQLNVKQLQTIQINDTEYGATSCLGRYRTTTRNITFANVEQINALEQKGSGNFSAWVIEACRGD